MTLTDEQAPEPNAPSRQPATPKPYEIEGAIVARLGVALTILLALFFLACGGAGQAVDSSNADANPPAAAVEPTTNGTVPADATPANPEEEDPDLRELLDRTVLNMSELPSLTATTATETRAKGATIRQQQEITAEAPGRAYLLQTGYGGTVEVYLNGTQIYFRQPGGDWIARSAEELGINPDSLTQTLSVATIATNIEMLAPVSENGETLTHLHFEISGDDFLRVAGAAFLAGSPAADELASIEFQKFEFDYFILADQALLRRGNMTMGYSLHSSDFLVTVEFSYANLGQPVSFLADLPDAAP